MPSGSHKTLPKRLPPLNWLRVFEAAARFESFARAAEQLNMSSAAVSQQIKALEGQLGTALFTRRAHSVELTDTGRAYLPPVQQALLTLQSATQGIFGASPAEQLLVRSVLIFAHGVLAPALPQFESASPGINLTLSTGNSVQDFTQGYTDLQIVFGDPQLYGRSSDRLMGERLFPVATPEIASHIRHPGDLLGYDLMEVATHRAGWPLVLDHLMGGPAEARFKFCDNSIIGAVMAAHGMGVLLARAPASDATIAAAGLVPCLEGFSLPGRESYHLVYPDADGLRPAAVRFRDWIMAYCAGVDPD